MKQAVVYVKKPNVSSKALQDARRALLPIIVGGVVHELNQPLTMLNIVSDTLRLLSERNASATAEELGELATETASGAKRFQSIVEQLRELSSDDDQIKHININEAVSECVRLVSSKMRGLGYHITLTLKATAPVVLCSSAKLSYLIFGALFYMCERQDIESRRLKQKILFASAQTMNEIVLSCRSVSRLKKAPNLAAKDNTISLRLVQSLAKQLGGRASIVLNKEKQPILEMRLPLHKPLPE